MSRYAVLLAAVAGALTTSNLAVAANVPCTSDTYVTAHPGLGWKDSVHGSDNEMALIGTYGYQAVPLVSFDLSSYAGQTVVGNGQLTLNYPNNWSYRTPPNTQVVEMYLELSDWNEASTSWNSLPGPYGNMDSTILQLQTLAFDGNPNESVTWTVPSAVLQSWIDNPTSNHGLVFVSDTGAMQQDIWFMTKESGRGPQLTFTATIPEPSTIALLGIGVIGLAAYAWRCRAKSQGN